MTGPQLIAHLAQMNMWLEIYNVNILSDQHAQRLKIY